MAKKSDVSKQRLAEYLEANKQAPAPLAPIMVKVACTCSAKPHAHLYHDKEKR